MKMALCIRKSDLGRFEKEGTESLESISSSFNVKDFGLMDRNFVETDENYLQVIPYVALVTEDGKLFVYERGSSGDENRLHKKYSIGLGGHMDTHFEGKETPTFYSHLVDETLRELEEEVKIDENHFDGLEMVFLTTPIYTDTDEVSRVHVGIPVIVRINNSVIDELKMEEGVIEGKGFKTKSEMAEIYDSLEEWSKIMYGKIGDFVR